MRPGCFLFAIIFLLSMSCYSQPIGSWQEHFSYHSAVSVRTIGNQLITASPHALFRYDPATEEFNRITKLNGLSETGIQTINSNNSVTVIAYRNSQLDLLENNTTHSVNTIRLSSISADKRIYDSWMDDAHCLLATGFGLAVLNLEKAEIGDVYLIANGSAYSKMNAVAADQHYFYAAGESGFYRAPRAGLNLADFRNWTQLSGQNGLPSGSFQDVLIWKNSIYLQQDNRIYKQEGTEFSLWYEDDWNWLALDSSENALLISQRKAEVARVLLLNESANPVNQLEHPLIQWPKQSLVFQQQFWVADSINGLLQMDGNNLTRLIPNSPAGIGSGGLLAGKSGWWMATGEKLNQFTEGIWKLYQAADQNLPAGFGPIGPLAEASDGSIWAGSSNLGLAYLQQGAFTLVAGHFKAGGLALDAEQRLWITDDGATRGLVVRFPDGKIQSFEIPFFYPSLRVSEIVIDDLNQKWIIAPANGLFCFNQGASIENPGDDQWRYYQVGSGNGNLPSNQVLSMVKDKFGFIWLGTSDGIGILQCPEQVFSGQGCEVLLPVVQTDNFAGYLFKGEAVQAMAVDGANRKWIGTKNGIWLISAGGDETLLRFTTANSPLPDNDIRKIAIDPKTGTVLISTAQGLVSYQATATEGGPTSSNVLVYPNPVTPGYTGPIAIRGLVNNAVVKLTELNGRLVYQGRALGGQAIWNGLDLNGKRVSTGVYLVWISDDSRKEQAVTKIVFIQ